MKLPIPLLIFQLLTMFSLMAQTQPGITLTIDGNTRTFAANQREADAVDWDAHPVKLLFRKQTGPQETTQFEINLNFYESDIFQKVPITYTLPEANLEAVVIDLNFFDYERETKSRLNKRLVFREGTITIHELTREKIHLEFDGLGGEMMNREVLFPISGRVVVGL